MSSVIVWFLALLAVALFFAVEAWFVISLILFIVSTAKKKPGRKGMLVMFIVSAVVKTVLPFVVVFLALATRFIIV